MSDRRRLYYSSRQYRRRFRYRRRHRHHGRKIVVVILTPFQVERVVEFYAAQTRRDGTTGSGNWQMMVVLVDVDSC